jgi:hypothetical protein
MEGVRMTCDRFHVEISREFCREYQVWQEKQFPACHPCKGCPERIEKEKRPRALALRQGGRHKEEVEEEWYDSYEKKRVVEKECRTCKRVKAAKEFYKSPSCRDGLRKDCIVCDNRKRT